MWRKGGGGCRRVDVEEEAGEESFCLFVTEKSSVIRGILVK